MNFHAIESLDFGKQRFGKFTGVEKQLMFLSILALVLIGFGMRSSGPAAYVCYGISAVSLWSLLATVSARSGEPYKAYHYPMMIKWSAALGAAHGAGDDRFEFKANFFLALSFEGMGEEAANQIIQMTTADWFDAMHFFRMY